MRLSGNKRKVEMCGSVAGDRVSVAGSGGF